MLFIKHLIDTKLSHLARKGADQLWHPFRDLLKLSASDPDAWYEVARHCLKNLLSVIAQKENLSPAKGGGDQTFYQYHLPDKITGMLQELEARLYSQEITHYPIDQEFWTIAFLLFKVTEWTVWNYTGVSPYSDAMEKKAEHIFNTIPYSVLLWGDRDEIWFALMDKLRISGSFKSFNFEEFLCGWETYCAILPAAGHNLITNSEHWPKEIKPETVECICGAKMIYFDQTEVRIALTGKEPAGKSAAGSGRFETELLKSLEQDFGKIE